MEMRCHKSKFAAQAEKWGWLELYDKPTETGSEMGFVLSDAHSITVYFDNNALFRALSDAVNVNMNVDDDGENNDG